MPIFLLAITTPTPTLMLYRTLSEVEMGVDSNNRLRCCYCDDEFSVRVFEISREWHCIHFECRIPEVEINDSLSLEYYCSRFCLTMRKHEVMERAGIPIRRAGIGPIERCAKCGGPVDMTRFHLAVVEEEYTCDDCGIQMAQSIVLAVVCNRCSSYGP